MCIAHDLFHLCGALLRRNLITTARIQVPRINIRVLARKHATFLIAGLDTRTRKQKLAVIMRKSIWLLAMNSIVADCELLRRHAQIHTADILDEEHDQRCPDDVPANDEQGANYLQPDLPGVASNSAAWTDACEG
jgi:hypothetical protein